ncbi:Marvel domain [Cinara cedri]|uniref:Marvel domain n=1 Tax=Cinara cedri TaxID=506608 RepID=A0A5E4MSJ8_9HEMI|nr:Marvel domain [Cinara cedri]
MYMVSRPYVRSSSRCCIFCSCLNIQYFTTACGILKIIQLVLGSICQSIMLFYGTKYMPTFGTSYESFLTTVAGCLMTTSVISVSYLLSKNTEVLVRSTLFEIMFGIFASICYFSSSSLLTMAVYMLLFPIFMTVPFTSLFSSIILAYTIGFILSALYALDAYWAFKYYKGFP